MNNQKERIQNENIFLNSISSTAAAPREFFAPAFLKKKQMFIKSNILFQRVIFGLFILFAARGRDEIRAANMGTPHQTDHWVLERKKHFLKANNLNIK